MDKKILITGASGFAGSHLLEHLINKGYKNLFGTYYSDSSLKNFEKKTELLKVDLREEKEVFDLAEKVKANQQKAEGDEKSR